ncbi:MAG: sodium/solute symporter [Zetaproteobacteria bacterium]|nr:sodium/solute symporter [Zetaproteobacteria bacterium]
MDLNYIDYGCFAIFIVSIVVGSIFVSGHKHEDEEAYFLAGRSLRWWTIGLSLIAANISTEHFVGMAGRGHEIGLAIASYEWMAAVTLVLVGSVFLPRFISMGIFTVPQYLQHRYGETPRLIMAWLVFLAYIFVALATVLYSGSLTLKTIFGTNLYAGIWAIGLIAGAYTIYGGLKAVVWGEVIHAATLLAGGAMITVLGVREIGGVARFMELSADKLHTVLPWDHPEMPWLAVFIGGLWIPNIFYWGLNQFISQRALAARDLQEAQKGILLAAIIKLFIPFIIVIPGMIAYHLYADQIAVSDMAYPYLITQILPSGLKGIMLAALFGAVLSTMDSVINSASTIFTMDIYKNYRPNASSADLVRVGRLCTALLVVFGCLWAPIVGGFPSVFQYIQMVWGFISPGVVAAFVWGLFNARTPTRAAVGAMLLNPPIYLLLLIYLPDVAFLHHIGITFLAISAYIYVVTYMLPETSPAQDIASVNFKKGGPVAVQATLSMRVMQAIVLGGVTFLYVYFY